MVDKSHHPQHHEIFIDLMTLGQADGNLGPVTATQL